MTKWDTLLPRLELQNSLGYISTQFNKIWNKVLDVLGFLLQKTFLSFISFEIWRPTNIYIFSNRIIWFFFFSICYLVHEMSKNSKGKGSSHFYRTKCDIFKCLVLSNQQRIRVYLAFVAWKMYHINHKLNNCCNSLVRLFCFGLLVGQNKQSDDTLAWTY